MLSHKLRRYKSGAPTDANFKQTTLLLHGDGTNGGQNNTFLAANHASGGLPGGFGAYFDGTGDYLSLASNSAFDFGTGDFTVEAWIYTNTVAAGQGVIFCRQEAGTNAVFQFKRSGATLELAMRPTSSSSIVVIASTAALTANTWVHVAAVRQSGTGTIYINGSANGTGTINTNANPAASRPFTIGVGDAATDGLFGYFNGYISNARVVKGTAVYTSNFTVPTAPLTAITNTSLLTCHASTFIDGSTNNFTVTANGDAKVVTTSDSGLVVTRNGNTTQGTFSPFSVADGEWSNYFNGSSTLNTSNSYSALGSNAFTFECFVYLTASGSDAGLIAQYSGASGGFCVFVNSTLTEILISRRGVGNDLVASVSVPLNTWNHIVAVRSGTGTNQCAIFFNGTRVAQGTNSQAYTTGNYYLGSIGGGSFYLNGYMSNARMVVGSAIYDPAASSITVPTTPLTAVTNTSLLSCQSNRFVDNSTNNSSITITGSPQVRPFSPFAPTAAYSASTNGGSGYFDGTGDYLSIADSSTLRFGTSNFTIQAWIYRDAAGVVHSIASKGGASTGWVFQVHSDNKLRFTHTTTNIDSTGTIAAKQWVHVAVVREGTGTNQVKLYINGVNDGQGTVSTDFTQTEQLNIGADRGNANPINGYISGFKYNVGTAETITVPTAPPTGGTALLNFTNAAIIDNTGKNVLETVGNAQIDTGTKKFGTGALEFDGTGDWLTCVNNDNFQLGSGNFTIEFWAYTNSFGAQTYTPICGVWNANAPTDSIASWYVAINAYNATQKLGFSYRSSGTTVDLNFGTGTNSTGVWDYYAVCRSGNLLYAFKNGTLLNAGGTSITATLPVASATPFTVGKITNGNEYNGFIDDLRITKGIARYTANFTAPTAPFEDR